MTEPAVYTVQEAARILRCGRTAAYQAVRTGEIPSIKVGRSISVPRHRLEQLLGHENSKAAGINRRPRENNSNHPGTAD